MRLHGSNQFDRFTPGKHADLRQEVRQNFKDLVAMYLERGVEPMAIMAYIHMRDGNRVKAKLLLADAVCSLVAWIISCLPCTRLPGQLLVRLVGR